MRPPGLCLRGSWVGLCDAASLSQAHLLSRWVLAWWCLVGNVAVTPFPGGNGSWHPCRLCFSAHLARGGAPPEFVPSLSALTCLFRRIVTL